MSEADVVRSVVVERELPYPPEKVWRALSVPELVSEWLMRTEFRLAEGERFSLVADWGRVDCELREIEPGRRLAYSWDADELRSVVTWTLSPSGGGTVLRMEQEGFRPGQARFYGGARQGWPRFLDALEGVLARLG